MTEKKKIGEVVRERREAKGFSAVELAAAAGLSERSIYLLEKGVTRRPAKNTIAKIAAALGFEERELAALLEEAGA